MKQILFNYIFNYFFIGVDFPINIFNHYVNINYNYIIYIIFL